MGSSRAPPPPPLKIDKGKSRMSDEYTPTSARKSSSMSNHSSNSNNSSSRRKTSSPTVNVYTTCGRHTDQYLFGGRSLTDLARSVWHRNN